MRTKNLVKRIMSGVLCTVMTLSVTAAPMSAWASASGNDRDVDEYVASLPELEDVKDRLDPDEIVTAEDRDVEYGAEIDLKKDLTGIKIPDSDKLKVTFYEAKNNDKKDFSTGLAGKYKSVYFAEPANTQHPAYRFSRNITVKEAKKEQASTAAETAGTSAGSDSSGNRTEEHKEVTASGEDADAEAADPESDKGAASTAVTADKVYAATAEIVAEETDKTAASEAGAIEEKAGTDSTKTAAAGTQASGETATAGTAEAEKGEEKESAKDAAAGTAETEGAEDAAAGTSETEGSSAQPPASKETSEGASKEASGEGSTETASDAAVSSAGTTEAASAEASTTSTESAATAAAGSATGDTAQPSEETGTDDPYGDDSGWTVSGIIRWATEQEEISLAEMGAGETVTFEVPTKRGAKAGSTGTMTVEITKGERYHYYDYGLGTFWTHPYYVKYGNITATAYCIEPSKSAPDSGTYTITKLKDSKALAKVCYYGTKYSGDEGFFAERYPDFPAPERFIITHLAAGYANEGEDAFRGTYEKGRNLALEMYEYCQNMPDIPDVDMEFSDDNVTAYVEGSTQRTKEITFKADVLQTITFKLPSGVKLHNVSTGTTSAAGASVEIPGGTKFYFTAPLTQAQDTGVTWHSKMTGSVTKDYSAYTIKGGSDEEQDLALVFGEAVGDEKYVEMDVTWVQGSTLTITKTNAAGNKNLSGAVYGVYSDKDCKNLIVKMPATDSKGTSTVDLNATGTVYLKEITAPAGFKLSTDITSVSLTAGKTTTKTIKDDEILGSIKVTKEGQILTGATSNSSGTTFTYEKTKLANTTFSVTAAEEIKSADGTVVYKKGASVGTLKTNSSGEASISGLPMGSYTVTETGAPTNFVNKGESKTVTLKAGSTSADVTATASFTDDRQKAEVTAVKQDKLTQKALSGAVFGMYADADIKNSAGTVIVEKDTLIGKVTTGSDGKGKFSADLPLGKKFYVKELSAPAGYKLNGSDTYSFTTTYTNDQQATITFSHTFTNEEIRGKLTIYKEGEVLTGADATDAGTTFKYETKKQKGATFSVYAGADINSAAGKSIYKKGDLVKSGLVTGNDGSVTLDNLYLGTYTVKETNAPSGFVLNSTSKDVTLSLSSQSAEVVSGSATIKNNRQKVEVTAIKKDKLTQTVIKGAVYGLYASSDIKNDAGTVVVKKDTLIGKATTGTEGSAKFTADLPLGCSFYVKELSAPTGYKLNKTDVYSFTTTYTNDQQEKITFSHTFTNEEIRGKLTIYKEGEVLTGADVTDAGTTFKYETKKQKYATFAVYAGADIISAGGKTIYKKGGLVKDGLVTGTDGSVVLDNLYLGTYTVKETSAPENFVLNGESKDITLSLASLSGEVVLGEVTIRNERQKAKVTVTKQDDTTKNPLSGGIYGIYAGANIMSYDGKIVAKKDTFIEKVTTGSDGTAVFKTDLPLNNSYYVKEIQAPKNYYRNQKDTYSFTFKYTNEKEAVVSFAHTFENERVNARIDLTKVDKETGTPQGDAKFIKATYGLFARDNIVHPDGKTGVLYKAGAQVATLTTDKDGKAFIDDLYLGKYYIKELIPSEGYLLDETEYDIDCAYEGDLVKTVKKTCTSKEQVIKQPFQVIKAANNGQTDADLLQGVGFSAYLISSLKTNADGSYDFTGAKPIVLTSDGKTEMFTDKKGYAVSIPIPYGKYIVRETTTPHNFTPVDDFKVTITENHPTTPQQWRVLLDDEFEAKLKIIKKDDETKKNVLLSGTEFKVFDINANAYVEQVTTYPSVTTHTSYFTDENGWLILPNNLKPGHYRIEEVRAPYGYVLNHNTFDVAVDTNTAYQTDRTSGDAIIEVEVENHPVKGELTITKAGEILTSFDSDFHYEERRLSGAEFAVYAAEDIFTPDYQKDSEGNRIRIHEKDSLVTTVTTGEDGTAVIEDLPLGKYRVEETKAPEGFVLNTEPQEVTFSYLNQETPVIEQAAEFTNDRQRVEISVEKQDSETGVKVEGAVFGFYAAENINTAGGTMLADAGLPLVEADALLAEAVSGKDGTAVFEMDLPLGKYYVKEHKAPDGYVSSDEVLTFDASYQGQDIPVVKLTAVKKNEPTKVEFTKSDITSAEEIDGAVLTILTRSGEVVERWTTVKGEPHMVRCLTAGESYVLREETAPYGYLRAEDVVFTVEDTGEIQKVGMQDKVPTALLIIDKKGEFLDSVTFADTAKGTVERIFEYISGTMTSVTFEVYAAEDIKAADGVAEDYFKKDQLVGTITTDDTGIAKLGDLPVGRYYVVEKDTAHGYVLDGEPRYVDLSYRDQYTPIVVYDEKWQNVRQKVSIHLKKTDSETGNSLKGASFGLYAAEDILSASGDVLIKKDELIEMRATNENGEISFTADLPVDAKYCIQEVSAPRGYATNREAKEFTFEYEGPDKDTVSFDFEFVNEPTKVEISKTAITGGPEIPGAHLQVLDFTGNVVDEWVSEETPHLIKYLHANREYELVERKPADGYTTAESIVFTVKDTMEVQKVEMKDDVTKVKISKTDITGGPEIPGAKLTIFDRDGKKVKTWTSGTEPYYIEMLPIGSYTLREELAPDGYVRAEDVQFTVKDTGIEQKVEMKDKYTKVQVSKQNMTTSKEIPGAHLTLFDKDGKVIGKWVSTEEPHMIERLPAGEYMLREELAPDGYVRAEDVTFTVEETGEIQKVYMKDAYTKVQISKTDMVTKEEIPGAKLTVFDKNGEVIATWTSGKEPHMIERLKPGTYTLREELAPDGYIRAEDGKFTVKETGEIQKVAMVDDYTKVQISKTDMVTKEEIPGAKLYIFDKNGETVEKWTSGKEPHMIEKLKPGTYTLREELAPDGYIRAEDVKFTVKETGEIQKVAMVDGYTKVQISKTDMVTKKELPGAKLKIFDKDGKTVESWTSGKEPHMIEKLAPGTYTLREVTAPNGYEVAEDVKFTVKETGEIQKVSMVDAPKESKKSSGGGSSSSGSKGGSGSSTTRSNYVNPQTGDTTNVIVWIILLLLGGIMFGAFWYAKKEMDKDKHSK